MMQRIIHQLLACLVMLISSSSVGAVSARSIVPVNPSTARDYMLILSTPEEGDTSIPEGLQDTGSSRFAASLASNQAAPVIEVLDQLVETDDLVDYEVTPVRSNLRLTGLTQKGVERLAALPGTRLVPLEQWKGCAAAVFAGEASWLGQAGLEAVPAGSAMQAQVSGDWMEITVQPGAGWSMITGATGPGLPVAVVITNAGGWKTWLTALSAADGSFSFTPALSWRANTTNCAHPGSPYVWSIEPGDTVELTTPRGTSTTTAAEISAWLDPGADRLEGFTAPNRGLDIQLDVDFLVLRGPENQPVPIGGPKWIFPGGLP